MRFRCVRVSAVLLTAVITLAASAARADDFMGGVRVGYYTEAAKPFVGGELLVRLAPRVYFNPNIEAVLIDGGSYLTFNGDVHLDFPTRSAFFWLGAGVGVLRVDPEGPDNSDSTVAANFLAGVGFPTRSVVPYFQAKVIAKEDAEFSLGFGLRF